MDAPLTPGRKIISTDVNTGGVFSILGLLSVHLSLSLVCALIVVGIISSDNCGSQACAGLSLGYTTLFDVFLTASM